MHSRLIYFTNNLNVTPNLKTAAEQSHYKLLPIQDIADLQEKLEDNKNTILIMKKNETTHLFDICQELLDLYPNIAVVLFGNENEIDLKKALRSGACDVIFANTEVEEIKEVMERAEMYLSQKTLSTPKIIVKEDRQKRVVTVCSTKGGVGKTTLIVNLGAILSKKKYKVAVLDLNLQFGDIAMFYDVKPKKTIYDWVKEEYGKSNGNLDRFIIKHASGVDIIPAPLRPEFSEEITEEHISTLIQTLKENYDFLLIDTPAYLTEYAITSLELSTDILLTTFMDLPTLKNTKIYLETLESLNLKDKVKIILNREYKIKGIQLQNVEKILGTVIYGRIPNKEKFITTSVNEGKPFVLTSDRNPFSKSVNAIAEKLANSDKGSIKIRGRKQKKVASTVS